MFSEGLSHALREFCQAHRHSQEDLAERCDLSNRYTGKLMHGTASPRIPVFEKICNVLEQTPNDILGVEREAQLPYRRPSEVVWIPGDSHGARQPACPRCRAAARRERQEFCGHCGQMLSWLPTQGSNPEPPPASMPAGRHYAGNL